LILLILSYSLSNLQWYLLDIEALNNYQFYSYWFMPWALIMPTFLLFFGIKTIYPDRKIKNKLVYYTPFIIWLLAILVIRIQVIVFKQDIDLPMFYRGLPFWGEIVSAVYNFGVIIYLLKCIKKVAQEDFSVLKIKPQLKWFKHVLLVLFLGTFLWLFSEIAFLYEDENFYFYPLYLRRTKKGKTKS